MAVVEITIKAKITKRLELEKLLKRAFVVAFILILPAGRDSQFIDCFLTPPIDSQQALYQPSSEGLDSVEDLLCGLGKAG